MKEKRENVLCMYCKAEGQYKNQCPTLKEYLTTGAPNPIGQEEEAWCEIYKNRGHGPENCHLLQKYESTPRILYCNVCRSVGPEQFNCCAWQLMSERTSNVYKVQGDKTLEGITSQFPKTRGGYGGYRG